MDTKQKQNTLFKTGILSMAVLIALQSNVQAQENDWPCEQILVDTISAAVVWPYPLNEELADPGQFNAKINSLATKVTSQFSAGADEVALIEQFLNDISMASRSTIATALFTATLNDFNQRRQKYIRGIQKFTKKQKHLAHRLTLLLEQRDELLATEPSVGPIMEEISVAEQIFRNRENILANLCDQPVRIEANLGVIARAIAQYVE